MSLELRTSKIYQTNGDILEGATATPHAFDSTHDGLPVERDVLSRVKRAIIPKNISDLYDIKQLKTDNLFVSNTQKSAIDGEDWAVTMEVLHKDGIDSIDYVIKQFRGSGSEAMLVPLDLLLSDPEKYGTMDLTLRLLALSKEALHRHAVSNTLLIPNLQSIHGVYGFGAPDPFDELLASDD